ncbi:MAG: class I SAM-dependent methyltransferase [Thermomicrobiales bacterium]
MAIEPDAICRANLLQAQESRPEGTVVDIRAGRVEALPREDRSCDRVVMRSVLDYVQDRRRAFRECARVLKPHGRLGSVW